MKVDLILHNYINLIKTAKICSIHHEHTFFLSPNKNKILAQTNGNLNKALYLFLQSVPWEHNPCGHQHPSAGEI